MLSAPRLVTSMTAEVSQKDYMTGPGWKVLSINRIIIRETRYPLYRNLPGEYNSGILH